MPKTGISVYGEWVVYIVEYEVYREEIDIVEGRDCHIQVSGFSENGGKKGIYTWGEANLGLVLLKSWSSLFSFS
jgi:hypothetical protein